MSRFNTLFTCLCAMLGFFFLWTEATAATALEIDLHANDAVYDSSRNVIYASTAISGGFPNGNSILTIDPSNLEIIAQIYAGSEPT